MGYLLKKINQHSKRVFFQGNRSSDLYLDYILNSLNGYDLNYIDEQLSAIDKRPFLDQYRRAVLGRIANILSFQIKNNQNTKHMGLLKNLIFTLIEDMLSSEPSFGADFLMIELYFALTNIKGIIEDYVYSEFIVMLKKIDPFVMNEINCRKTPVEKQHNFVIYSMTGEYLRELLTGVDCSEYLLENWKIQKTKFDLNGMYRDPEQPMLYDLTVRAHLAFMLHMGYEGEIKKEIEDILMKSSMDTLFYLSSEFCFPYGGRSNSYHMNETLVACLCEYYADKYHQMNEIKIAGSFKRAARKSVEKLKRWDGHHLKNFFDKDTNYGGDYYGTYDAYMVTSACFLLMGYTMMNNKIREYTTPSEFGGYIIRTTDDFHMLFANCCKYSVQLDYQGNMKYESNGLGRVHHKDIPIELALSMPFSSNPAYLTGEYKQNKGRAIGAGWLEDGKEVYLAEQPLTKPAFIHEHGESRKAVRVEINYFLKQGKITEWIQIDKKGIHIFCSSDFAPVFYHIPVLIDNGKETTLQEMTYKSLKNCLGQYSYIVKWDDTLSCTLRTDRLYNRSGIYKSLIVHGTGNEMNIHLKMKKEGRLNGKIKKKK
ncbi:MAG: hypothetical protein JXQ23_03755 [Clostridia bacterium]|nr:hypothetical protein [Clostridia bacterium]